MRQPICTYCGTDASRKPADHVIQRCLWVEESNERSIKVPACDGPECNGRSDEAVLRPFFALFDARHRQGSVEHFRTPAGTKEYHEFLQLIDPATGKLHIDAVLTRVFVKMFMGLRRHLMGEDAWAFRPASDFQVRQVFPDAEGGGCFCRPLPFSVEDTAVYFPRGLLDELVFDEAFREFSFGTSEGWVFLRHNHQENGNQFILACFVPELQTAEPGRQPSAGS